MALTDGWAKLIAPDARWLGATRAFVWPIKSSIIHSHPTVTHFFRHVDAAAENILSFYAPDLPASSRQNNGLPMMDGKDVAIVLIAYVFVVGLSLMLGRGSMPQSALQKKEKRLSEKIGPIFVFQAIYNIAQV